MGMQRVRPRWLPPREPEPPAGGFIEFGRRVLALLAVTYFFAFIGSALLWNELGTPGIGLSLCGLALAVTVAALHRGWPTVSAVLLVAGGMGLAAWMARWFPGAHLAILLAVPTLAGGLLLGWVAALGSGGVALCLLLRLGNLPRDGPALTATFLALIAVAGISVLARQALKLSDHWELGLFRVQHDLVQQLRARQGELNRTLKALDEAYATLRRTNEELLVARREAEEGRALKEQFVANVSHELRTPLNLILGFAEIMYLYPETYEGVRWTRDLEADVQELYRASRHLQSLVNDILDLSRIDASRLPIFRELHDVRSIVIDSLETISPLLRQRGLALATDFAEVVPEVFVDPTRIRQVMLNLLSNAVRYTDEGGITVAVRADEESVIVSVSDTGMGIPEDQFENVFEEFRQLDGGRTGRGGAGIGLALSRQFVELHGGRVWLESQVAAGSTFHFALPLPGAKPQTVSLRRVPDLRRGDLSQAPLIVVDADPGIAQMIQRHLGDRAVIAVESPEEAEAIIAQHHPIVVVVNQLPDAPEEAWLQVLGHNAVRYGVPVVRCSIPSPSWLPQASGLDDCLTKPVSRETLAAVIERRLATPDTLLVVDDDPGFVSLMERLLSRLPKVRRLLTAYGGEQALEITRAERPGLVFLDLAMPGMDGFALARAIRAEPGISATPIVAVTATSYAEETLMRRGHVLTVRHTRGITSGAVVELVRSVTEVLRPEYV